MARQREQRTRRAGRASRDGRTARAVRNRSGPPDVKPSGRPAGSRSEDYDEKKRELARQVLRAVVAERGTPSLRELARAAAVSIPTLKHYFGDRSGAIAAALRTVEEDARDHLRGVASPGDAEPASSLRAMALELAGAWREFGVGALFAAGMAAGVADPAAGPGYLDGVLEPTMRAVEQRLRVHAERGELRMAAGEDFEIRTAALAFLSPVIVALLHQHDLSGARCRPLDIPAFLERHVERFVEAYRARPGAR